MKRILPIFLVLVSASAFAQQNVGIGTNDPKSKLDVKGGVTVGSGYSGTYTAPTNGAIIQGQVGIGTNSPDAKSALDVSATDKGVLLPRLTTAQATTLGATLNTTHKGLLIFNVTDNRTMFWDGAQWKAVGEGAGGPPSGAAGGDLTGTYPSPTVATGAINSTKILDGTITNADLASPAVDLTTKVFNVLPVNNGGTGNSSLTPNGVVVGNGTSPVLVTSGPAAGQVLLGNSSGPSTPVFTTLTGDIATVNGAGSVNLAATGVSAGTYGNATQVATVTIDTKGRITSASNTTITGVAPSGTAGGDLSGTYPNPTVAKINGATLGSTTPTDKNILIADGANWVSRGVSGDATISNTGTVTLSTVNSNTGTWGTTTQVPTITVDAKGRITSASHTTISGTAPGGTAGGDLSGTYPNPTVDGLQGVGVSATAPTSTNNVLAWNGSVWAPANVGVPTGAIILWSGTKAAIPVGWALCDGTNGTPNLLDRFVLSVAVSAYTGSDINQTGGNSNHTLTVAELPAHSHTGTTDATTPSGSFTGTNASIAHTGTFTGTSATTSSTNTDHTHTWGGTWNSDQSNLGGAPYGDGNSSIYTDGVGYWSMSTGAGLTTTSTNIDHTHNWGGWWSNDNATDVGNGNGDGSQNTYSDGASGFYTWGSGGITQYTNYTGGHAHSLTLRNYQWNGSSGDSWWTSSNGGYHGVNTSYNGDHSHSMVIPAHRHYIRNRAGGGMNSNASHSHTVYNHRHWIQVRNSGAMSANASHNHTVTATGTISINNASYTPAGTVTVGSHTHSFTTGNTGSGTVIDIRPSFYRLAYIMKL